MRRAQRLSGRRSLWQHVTVMSLMTSSHSPAQQFAHTWWPRPRETCVSGSLVRPVRFFGNVNQEEKDLVSSSSLPADVGNREPPPRPLFYEQLQHCSSPSDVLDLTCRYAPTVRQTSSCLTHMWNTTKKMSEEQQRLEQRLMFEHAAFDKLLSDATRSAARMRNEDVAYSLLAVVNLGVPQRSRVVQTFLRTCQERLNDFDETALSILASCVAHMEDTPNVAALKKGMRLLVEARLPAIKNVVTLQTMMRALGKNVPLDLKRKLEGKALSVADQFSLPNSQYMISTMAAMGFYSKPLLDICCKRIQEDLSGIPFGRLLTVLHSCKELHYRSSDLLTDISDYAASMVDIWNNKQLLILLSVLESFAFCPSALVKALAEKVIAEPGALALKDILCILKVYSSVGCDLEQQRQPFLESLSQALDSYLTKMSGFELLKAVYHLCMLGHFPPAPLQQLLQSSTLEHFKTTAPRFLSNQERMFRTVDLCLRLERPALQEPLEVPPFLLGDPAARPPPPARPWLSQSLRSVLEERPDVALEEAVLVENCHLIDAVISKPLPSRSPEDSPAESSQRVALLFSPNSFCLGTSRLRGGPALKARHLRMLGYDAVLVFDQGLHAMSEEERTHLLRTRLFPERRPSSDAEQPES